MPKKQQASFTDRSITAIRDNPVKSITALLAFLLTMGGVFAQSDNIAAAGTWIIPSPIAYVRSHVRYAQSDVLKALRDTQIEQAEGKRDASKRAINDLELRSLNAPSPAEKLKIDQNLRDERDTLDAIKRQINTLNQLRGQ